MILVTLCVCGGEGGGDHNLVNLFIDFFHVSDHLEQFGGVSFFLQKIYYFDRWGVLELSWKNL